MSTITRGPITSNQHCWQEVGESMQLLSQLKLCINTSYQQFMAKNDDKYLLLLSGIHANNGGAIYYIDDDVCLSYSDSKCFITLINTNQLNRT